MNDKTMREAFERENPKPSSDMVWDERTGRYEYAGESYRDGWLDSYYAKYRGFVSGVKWQSQQAQGDHPIKVLSDDGTYVHSINDSGHCTAIWIEDEDGGVVETIFTAPAPAAVPTKRKAGFLMTDRNGKEHFISINRTCENADDLHGWTPVYFGNEDCSPQHEPAAVPEFVLAKVASDLWNTGYSSESDFIQALTDAFRSRVSTPAELDIKPAPPVPDWRPCNPACDPEFGGHRDSFCTSKNGCQHGRSTNPAPTEPDSED